MGATYRVESSRRKPLRFPGRQELRVGPDGLLVLLSRQDRDLAEETWYQREAGQVQQQQTWTDGTRKFRKRIYLHHVVAERKARDEGLPPPTGHVSFKNGQRLDCRRENLVWSS